MLLIAVLLSSCSVGGPPATADPRPSARPVAPASPAAVAQTAAPEPTQTPTPDLEAVKRFRSVRGHDTPPEPAAVRIPAIGVDSPLLSLGRASDGAIEVPGDFQRAGWFREGPVPGQRGPAVILGHVDSRRGPAVFYRLRDLEPGDEVLVDHVDGAITSFVVDRVERFDKDDFPTHAVYYPTLDPVLRLVTCGGTFDRRARSYRDNIIVFATLSAEAA